jgi:hypothetical protein
MAEIAESAKEGLLGLVVSAGLQVMAAVFAEDAERLAGRKASARRVGHLGRAADAGDPAAGAGRRWVRRVVPAQL